MEIYCTDTGRWIASGEGPASPIIVEESTARRAAYAYEQEWLKQYCKPASTNLCRYCRKDATHEVLRTWLCDECHETVFHLQTSVRPVLRKKAA